MIRNPDGTSYMLKGSINNYDPSNPDHELMDKVDQEYIEKSGAPIEYYRVIIDGRVDILYLEQREKLFLQNPFCLKAVYEPVPVEMNLTQFGIDPTEQMIFSFNRNMFLGVVGERPREGSLIRTCDEGLFWEIIQNDVNIANEDRKLWGKHRFAVVCQKYQAEISDRSPSGQGRESLENEGREIIKIF